jgi:hypothetical protein
MIITRKIERRLELTADEVYEAMAKKYDLPLSEITRCHFHVSDNVITHHVLLISTETHEPVKHPAEERPRTTPSGFPQELSGRGAP